MTTILVQLAMVRLRRLHSDERIYTSVDGRLGVSNDQDLPDLAEVKSLGR
jgi:hypothetical protein